MNPADVVPTGDRTTSADVPGPLLASGMSADVYALDDGRVLRRYREGRDTAYEVALLRHARAAGFPAPEVHDATGSDIVMERLYGPTLLQALAAEEVTIADGAAMLADLHQALHEVPAPAVWPEPSHHDRLGIGGGPYLVHLDLHPGNVVLTEGGPVLVDWANARSGTRELDVAVTAVVLAEVAVDAGGAYSQAARALLAAFLGWTDVSPADGLVEAAAFRAADPILVPGERELVPEAATLVRTLVELVKRD